MTFIGAANNATVTSADNKVCNSIVHIVNAVLLPSASLGSIPIYNGTSNAPGWFNFLRCSLKYELAIERGFQFKHLRLCYLDFANKLSTF